MAETSPSARKQYKTHFKNQQDQELIRLSLHKSPFFSCLDEEQLDRLVNTAELKQYQQGAIVILEGCVDDDEDEEHTEATNTEIESTSTSIEDKSASVVVAQDLDVVGPAEADEDEDIDDEEVNEEYVIVQKPQNNDSDDRPSNESDDRPSDPAIPLESESTERINDNAPHAAAADDESEAELPVVQDEQDVQENEITSSPLTGEKLVAPDSHDDLFQSSMSPSSSFLGNRTDLEARGDVEPPASSTQHDERLLALPPPPRSGIPRSIYIVRKGSAGVWYQPRFNPAQLRPGALFGEGGFLFGRQHSASVMASEPLECWVVDISTFRNHVLPSDNMRQIFQKYAAKKDEKGDAYMTMDDFVEAVNAQQLESNSLPTMQDSLISLRIVKAYSILRHKHTHLSPSGEPIIYLNDFCFFHLLMARPDPEVDIAFLLMDEKQTGRIFLEDLAKFLRPVFPDLDFQSQFFQRYFGKDGSQSIRQTHYSQFLVDLQREMGKQAFLRAVERNGTPEGYIAPGDFVQILKTACGWRLPQGMADRLDEVYCLDHPRQTKNQTTEANETSVHLDEQGRDNCQGDQYFAYGDFLAFQEVLGNLPFICNLIDRAQELKKGPVSYDDFKVANRVLGLGGRLSRRQVEIVFSLFDLDRDGYVSHEDTVNVCGVNFARRLVPVKGRGDKLTFAPPPQYRPADESIHEEQPLIQRVASRVMHFGFATVVGGVSVGLLYPADLVKTRLMNQRIGQDGSRMYRSSLDCIQQALRVEGFGGLYRGLSPQLLGVAPERAIKLQVHDLLRQAFHAMDEENSRDKKPSLWLEALAGGCAGACQLLVTNPMEISKIRLQIQGETSRLLRAKGIVPPAPPNFLGVIKDLGFPGVYRGASACLLRDVPFSAIYFPTYSACKEILVELNSSTGKASPSDLLLAGTIAGVPAALITTPADVVKSRLQSIARPGETSYAGIRDCATKMYRQEGIAAFFQGSSMRVLRLAPQFGISLLVYESLAQLLGFERASRPPTIVPVDPLDYSTAFLERAPQGSRYFDSWLHPATSDNR